MSKLLPEAGETKPQEGGLFSPATSMLTVSWAVRPVESVTSSVRKWLPALRVVLAENWPSEVGAPPMGSAPSSEDSQETVSSSGLSSVSVAVARNSIG